MTKTEAIEYINEHVIPLFDKESAIVLVGSTARAVNDESSDIDLLVISENTQVKMPAISNFHFQQISENDFLANLQKGEDFEAWAVRFGIVLQGSPSWARILDSESARTWPSWQSKVIHATRRLFIGDSLLEMGDFEAAREELLYALGHISRGLLFKANVFPLSRPELSQQVQDIGYRHLAILHEKLRTSNEVSVRTLGLARRYAKKLLIFLDRDLFSGCAKTYRSRKLAKLRGRRTQAAIDSARA